MPVAIVIDLRNGRCQRWGPRRFDEVVNFRWGRSSWIKAGRAICCRCGNLPGWIKGQGWSSSAVLIRDTGVIRKKKKPTVRRGVIGEEDVNVQRRKRKATIERIEAFFSLLPMKVGGVPVCTESRGR